MKVLISYGSTPPVRSVDGFHAIDLANFVADFPTSNLATLSGQGVTYTQNFVPPPTDSFPGVVNLLTGARALLSGNLHIRRKLLSTVRGSET